MVAFIDAHRGTYGVEPICAVLPIAPSTYFAHKACEANPRLRSCRAQRDAWLTIGPEYDAETVAMWQSLSCGALYTCCNCMGACPAGEQHVGAYQTDREGYEREVVQPLLQRGDKIFVLPGSDAETRAAQLFPPERVKRIGAGVKPPSARSFLEALPVVFQPGKAEGVQATYHFVFSGADPVSGTVRIDGRELTVSPGLEGQPDLTVAARGEDWVSVLGGDLHPVWAVVSGKMKLKGKKAKMKDFMRCFPL